MKLKPLFTFLLSASLLAVRAGAAQTADAAFRARRFVIGTNTFLLDGKPFQIRCGEMHAPRVPREYWQHRLQMTRAMGLNTVCAYLFWNLQEPRPGEFVWTGQADAAAFCRLAQREGLWVILRPGPYACAEWEMGGLPWWLLKESDIQVRTRDPRFLGAVRRYLKEVGRVLGPLQITQGGPILMVQVENEYGSYGQDAGYMGELRQMLLDAGFEVPLFCCNPPTTLKNGYRSDLFPVVNFGSDPAGAFRALREILPQGPLMCGEFYPGWFDTWGAPHHQGNSETYLADLRTMLQGGASFSIYMAHGGTSFGLWSGADRPFKPDTSSYDYDAPISEAGWPTQKFYQTRALFSQYLLPGEHLPEPPATNPVVAFAPVQAQEAAPLFANLPAPVADRQPRNMEQYDQGYGWILYRTTLAAGPASTLEAAEVHDFGYVFLDGERVGVLDRRQRAFQLHLPQRAQPVRLDILVEPMGRVNFGPEVHDRKGLLGPVRVAGAAGQGGELTGWQVYSLPLDAGMLSGLRFSTTNPGGPAFWRARLDLKQPGDTFLDMRSWGKGVVWVNGHCLGRFWNIGPTQTMYLPGAWLHAGQNELIIADLLGPEQPLVAGLTKPILDQLRPELDFRRSQRPEVRLNLSSAKPSCAGQFAPGPKQQKVAFEAPAQGRYFCLESLSAHDGKPYAAVAELNLLDEHGQWLSHASWSIAYVDSEEREREDGAAENAIDGQVANFWHTQWGSRSPSHPHRLVLDLGQSRVIAGFEYVPRPGAGAVGGRIKDYRIYVGDQLVEEPKGEPNFHHWAPAPPMGWNSWDCFATTITEAQTKAQAEVLARKLARFGWQYLVVDIQWYEPHAIGFEYRKGAQLTMDPWGRLLPASNRFPSGFEALGQYLHNQGLKFGIHLMRGIPRLAVLQNTPIQGTSFRAADIADTNSLCAWNTDMYGVDTTKPGAQKYYDSVFELIASWGVDFVKVDDLSRPYHQGEIEAIRKAIDRTGRPMVLSTSPGATPLSAGEHVRQHANLWRISDDFWDQWPELQAQFQRLRDWTPFRGPGHFPDADMLPLGVIELGKRTSRFTQDEQYTLMTLWCMARSPLMLGADLTRLDDFTLSLLTNEEVLAVNQHSNGNRELFNRDGLIAWAAEVPGATDQYLGLFNTRETPAQVPAQLTAASEVRDLWQRRDLGRVQGEFAPEIAAHGAKLYRLSPGGLGKSAAANSSP